MTDMQELVDRWLALHEAERTVKIEKHDIELQMRAIMSDDRAEVFDGGLAEVTYRGGTEWDQDALTPLWELLSEDEVEKMLTPQKPAPPRKWDMRYVKGLVKRGGEIRKVVESAEVHTPPQLKVKVK